MRDPEEVRRSNIDPNVYLYYRRIGRLYCVVVKHQTDEEGFIITAYPVDKVKEGEIVWTR